MTGRRYIQTSVHRESPIVPNIQITFHTGTKQYSSDQDVLKNFICESIIINDQEVFNEKERYLIDKDDVDKIPTVQFNTETNLPIIDKEVNENFITENENK